ncbi:hypothetical protein T484DRAFT_3222350 [Baffinella frigidus]|nr:hypothetical protein T484DRAFT_3222350 [Cryptophyta sp. CCMP2293]
MYAPSQRLCLCLSLSLSLSLSPSLPPSLSLSLSEQGRRERACAPGERNARLIRNRNQHAHCPWTRHDVASLEFRPRPTSVTLQGFRNRSGPYARTPLLLTAKPPAHPPGAGCRHRRKPYTLHPAPYTLNVTAFPPPPPPAFLHASGPTVVLGGCRQPLEHLTEAFV